MDVSKICIKNQSTKPQSYTVSSEEIYILESVKNVLVSPVVSPGASCTIVIDNKFYIWAALTDSPRDVVVSRVEVGEAFLLRSCGRKPVLEKINLVPESGCFSISIDPKVLDRCTFGLGIKTLPSADFHPLTTTEANEIATYNFQPSRIFEVAVNERYSNGDELLNDAPPNSSVVADLQTGDRIVAVVHSINSGAGRLHVEDPWETKRLQEEVNRLNKEEEQNKKKQAAAEAEAKRQAEQRAAAEGSAAERAAVEKAAAERARNLQSQSILPGHSIAATAWSNWHIRVYFQDGRGSIRESRHDDGVWSGGDIQSALVTAKMRTPISAISWDCGKQIRIYYLSVQNILQEYCYSSGYGWYHGNLNNHQIRVAACSQISAIYWPVDTSLRVYFQGPASWRIQEYCYSGQSGWVYGTMLWDARPGSSIAATRWFSGTLDRVHRNLHIRIYYQDAQSYIKELCWEVGGWYQGGFSQRALAATPIASFSWHDYHVNIRVLWQDSQKAVWESKHSKWWANPSKVMDDVDETCPFSAVELQNGEHHRLYLRNRTSIIEQCNGKYGGYWFRGEFVVN